MSDIRMKPGAVSLSEWRAIYRGAHCSLEPTCEARISASAAAVQRIIDKGEPVYGINTGFGKLASVRIDREDLATLQRNIVLSHSAGVGEPTSPAIVRLMIALKVASLAQGASGVQMDTIRLLCAMLEHRMTPIIPSQGSVGPSTT